MNANFKETMKSTATLMAIVLALCFLMFTISRFQTAGGATPSQDRRRADATLCRNDSPIYLGDTNQMLTQVQLYGAQYDEAHGTCEVTTYDMRVTLLKGCTLVSVGDGPGDRTGLGRSWQVTLRASDGITYSHEIYPWPEMRSRGLFLTHATRKQPILEIR